MPNTSKIMLPHGFKYDQNKTPSKLSIEDPYFEPKKKSFFMSKVAPCNLSDTGCVRGLAKLRSTSKICMCEMVIAICQTHFANDD